MKKFLYPLVAVLLIASACTEEEKSGDLSQEEAQAVITNMSQDMESDVIDMVESEGVEAVMSMADFLLETDESVEFMRQGQSPVDVTAMISDIKGLGKAFAPKARRLKDVSPEEEEDFSFEESLGIYVWNDTEGYFEIEDETVDFIEFRFPAEGSTTNNASLFVYDLQQSEEELSAIDAALKIDNEVVASVDLEIEYGQVFAANKISLDLFLKPFTYKVDVDDSAEKSSSVSVSIAKDDEVLTYVDLSVDFKSSLKLEATKVDGAIGYRTVEIKGDIDLAGIEAAEGERINDYIDVKLYAEGSFVGDLELDITTDEEIDIFVVYSDGTSESLLDLLAPVFDEIEDILVETSEEVI
ncbi:hypothetical protein SAMN04488028_101360 [Reichenbachiella agariperforans]|uniref:Uncharacterized protein n=1 Tax=Reichenbachiella agariperforans TaxID=156994 RepID=A0A1M6JXN8_REIAG|nr:hypothetical protein [Reichenbachiella agariperforans]SHJ51413.1 hypothetical protein SAMN04488028_101360 [Reichenbachiella agariperforans]